VLIDCPPNLGIITLNGLRIASGGGYIIPTIPDVLSTYGIPQIVKRVGEFSTAIAEPIDALGIVVSKFREQSTVHQNVLRQLRKSKDAPVFATVIKENNQVAGAAEFTPVSTLRQKWGYQGQYEAFKELTEELLAKVSV
jgi:chromosome partitioning protein